MGMNTLGQDDAYVKMRESMVKNQIEQRGITHAATLQAMKKVPRHLFVPKGWQEEAYTDQPLPIGNNQTISQPYIVAFMTSAIDVNSRDRVLEIGTGSGYQAAVLAEIADSVYTIEIIDQLYYTAKKVLKETGYSNIHLKLGDGYAGWPEFAPFDKILVTAAIDSIPPPLLEQLKEGGKMIIPVGPSFSGQNLILIEKKGNKIKKTNVLPVRFVPFTRED